MSRYRRWNELLELLGSRGQLQVEDAAKALNVSAATIRRDFDELASQQMLTRIRGGAVAGATAHHEGEASINRLMGRQARQVIIVADSSKVGQRAFARICTPAEIDVLVTDAGIAAADAARLQDAGVDVVTV